MSEAREALFWSAEEDSAVRCGLCPHRCHIAENASGLCGVRENLAGKLIASGYGQVSSTALDPIEKKPLHMFHPGEFILSIGGFGCNFRCGFCQNSEISLEYGHLRSQARHMSPKDVAALAAQTVQSGNIGVAYTYNEPLIGYEFLYDCALLVRGAGLHNVIVTNGFINKEPLETILPLVDAMNIDLKGFSDRFYQSVSGNLDAVKETISMSAGRCHIEVTTLVVPGENEEDVAGLAQWLSSVDPGIPLHLTRFFPRYLYSNMPPTKRETIIGLGDIAKKYLKHVFYGNMR